MDTLESRKQIGFPQEKKDWTNSPAVYDEHTLSIAGHPVMEDWELEYMDKLADIACSKGGKVLEVGYGMGLSAKAIQKRDIDSHFIIECHPGVIKKAVNDCQESLGTGKMHLLSGFWEDITPLLESESFDAILFDTYPLTEEQVHGNHFWFFKEAWRLLKKGGIFTYYSDEAEKYAEVHLTKLMEAGFKPQNIKSEIIPVNPPEDCKYWVKNTILAPIIVK